ncbi:MAG: tRNA 2-thiocytidine biosynthesis protein TtcA [Clostridiales bacterium]|jgi:tRNA(Ile)-lysidine synthase TilS/MesJ|nr:tRNA 2-thiocytidine biosynthesis protein TtcA [Clostridiales bacterium]
MKELTALQKIERSIHKKFRREIWRKFISGVQKYEMIQANDKIAICISGGKDSMLMAKLMQQLHRHSDVPFELIFLVMNPGYNKENFLKIKSNAEFLKIPITVFDSDIFEIVSKEKKSPCYLCARMRRGFLYANAQKLGCNKIALGHHMSDVVETTLMGMLYGAQFQTMMPKLKSRNFPGMELIRPMYCVEEAAILAWKNYNRLSFIQCACPLSSGENESTREAVKKLIENLKKENKDIEKSVFKSLHMLNLDTAIGYKLNEVEHSFLDGY